MTRRIALLVTNADYRDPEFQRLRAPTRDGIALAEVLRDPTIGAFETQHVANVSGARMREHVADLFADRAPDDEILFYYSGHGVRDDYGSLYFVGVDTRWSRLSATGVAAEFVAEELRRTRSKRVVVILDCCYSGAFAAGLVARSGTQVEVQPQLSGIGRVVITASTATEYAFEPDQGHLTGEGSPSVFTNALVDGLRSGMADRDGDGLISVDELYQFAYEQVIRTNPRQTPSITSQAQGPFYFARSTRPRDVRPPVVAEPSKPPAEAESACTVENPAPRRDAPAASAIDRSVYWVPVLPWLLAPFGRGSARFHALHATAVDGLTFVAMILVGLLGSLVTTGGVQGTAGQHAPTWVGALLTVTLLGGYIAPRVACLRALRGRRPVNLPYITPWAARRVTARAAAG